jgi:putative FmdB family regulatory protein
VPTYDYECSACGHKYELFQSITAKPVKRCPECGRPTARRLIGTGAGVIFRGSGFYCTDYRSDGYKSRVKAEKEGANGKAKSNGDGAAKATSDSSSSSGTSSAGTKAKS